MIINPFDTAEDPTTDLPTVIDLIIERLEHNCHIIKKSSDEETGSSSYHIPIKDEIIHITGADLTGGRKAFAAKLFDQLGLVLGDAPYQDWHIFLKFIADNVATDLIVVDVR